MEKYMSMSLEISPSAASMKKKAIFILYDWSSNAILATSISSTNENVIIETFTENIKYLESRGFRPQFNIMDNVASHAIKKFLEKEKITSKSKNPTIIE